MEAINANFIRWMRWGGMALLSLRIGFAQKLAFDFNSAGQFVGGFYVYENGATTGTSPYRESSNAGIGNSGAVLVLAPATNVTTDATAIAQSQSFNFSTAPNQISISEDVHLGAVNNGSGRLLQLGFVNDATAGMNDNPGLAFISLRLSSVGNSGTTFTPQFQEKLASGDTFTTGLSPNLILSSGNWYRLSGTFVNLGGGQFEASGLLEDLGSGGLATPIPLYKYPLQNFDNSEMTADNSVWPAFRAFYSDGASALDDLTVEALPEAPPLGLLFVAALILPLLGRRGHSSNRPRSPSCVAYPHRLVA